MHSLLMVQDKEENAYLFLEVWENRFDEYIMTRIYNTIKMKNILSGKDHNKSITGILESLRQ